MSRNAQVCIHWIASGEGVQETGSVAEGGGAGRYRNIRTRALSSPAAEKSTHLSHLWLVEATGGTT